MGFSCKAQERMVRLQHSEFLRLLPDHQTIAELFPGCEWVCSQPERVYRSVRVYTGRQTPEEDTLYLISSGDGFPVDTFPWVACENIAGTADHICCLGFSREEVVDSILMLYSGFQEREHTLDALLFRGAGLEELCELAAQMLDNPVYIHDDWFIMMAKSSQVDEIIAPEYIMSSEKGFLPRVIIDDFRDDSDYLETYSHRTAQMWESGSGPACLYVNLWDGPVYRGRMLVVQTNHPIAYGDFRLAEVLAQAAMQLIKRKQLGEHQSRSMDEIMFDLLRGQKIEGADQTLLLNMLKWQRTDQLLCVRIQSQQPDMRAVTEHALHSDLFRAFPGSYIMMTENQQCLVLNLTRMPIHKNQVRHILAPICRDYLLYAGISSPIQGIRELSLGYTQAEAALNQAFRQHNEKWILSFPEIALRYLFRNLSGPLQPAHLICPDLQALRDYDREKGTPYYETLRAYILEERDIPRTSERLIIHRTTLLYRLKKIQSMISVNLDDPWERLYAMLSLWVLEQED